MTAQEYWDGPGIRFLNEYGTLPTVEERVKEGYSVGWDNGWNVARDTRDEVDRHRVRPSSDPVATHNENRPMVMVNPENFWKWMELQEEINRDMAGEIQAIRAEIQKLKEAK
jgi:PHD/YefM family antitoxin component YafN of YafNO toxin-antitoxin module